MKWCAADPGTLEVVMAGLDPAIHDLLFDRMTSKHGRHCEER
jgi:hypothetical protein